MKQTLKRAFGSITLAIGVAALAVGVGKITAAAEEETVKFTVSRVQYVQPHVIYVYGEQEDGSEVTFDGQYLQAQDVANQADLADFFGNVSFNGKALNESEYTYQTNFFNTANSKMECFQFAQLDTANGFAPLAFEDGDSVVFQEGLRLLRQEGTVWSLSSYELSKTQKFVYNAAAQAWTEEVDEEPEVPIEYVDCKVGEVKIGMKNSLEIPFFTLDGTEIEYPVEGVNAQDVATNEKFAPFFDNILINDIPLSQPTPGIIYAVHLFNPANGSTDHLAIFALNASNPAEGVNFKTGATLTLKEGLVPLCYVNGQWGLSSYKLVETKNYTYDEQTLNWVDDQAITGITLDKAEAGLETGKTLQLTATVTGGSKADKTVVWSTSDETIATVSTDGMVTAVATGYVTITATAADGKTATCQITVTSATEITSVMISQSRGTIEAGKTLDLTVAIKGNSAADTTTAVWTSSNESVAIVDQNGKVTAVGVGTCVITVTSADPTKKATCSITVTAPKEENTSHGCNGSGSVIGVAATGTGLLTVACMLIARRKKD